MKIYRNRKAKNHPSIEVSNDISTWKNMVMTHQPAKKKRYILLKHNPNADDISKSYVEKRVRNDPIKTRGELLKKYNLSIEDLNQIEEFLKNKKC